MAKKRKILFVSQEISPYVGESEISRLARYLPQAIHEKGNEIRPFTPRYGITSERRNQLHEVIRLSGMNLIIDGSDHPLLIKVGSIPVVRMQVYLIDNEDYFQRKGMVGDEDDAFYRDNDERMVFFARGTLETIKKLRWQPELVHCHGWFSMMTPLFVKKAYHDDPLFAKSKVVVSLYNEEFEAKFAANFSKKAQLSGVTAKEVASLSNGGYVELMKHALSSADGVTIGSSEVNAALLKHIKARRIPLLPYTPEPSVEEYLNFYDEILAKK
jgi:starch synthase